MNRDPYRYYRIEARELLEGLNEGVLACASGTATPDTVAQLLRQAHTLKGAARVVRQGATAEHAHRFEDLLQDARASGMVPRTLAEPLFAALDEMRRELDALDSTAPAPAATRTAQPAAPVARPQSMRIEIAETDRLLEELAQLGVQLGALERERAQLDHGRSLAFRLMQQLAARSLSGAALMHAQNQAAELAALFADTRDSWSQNLERCAAMQAQLRERVEILRLVPASAAFATLERAVNELAQALGKEIRFVARGAEQRFDAQLLAPLSEALLHLARNAADHGIEPPAERRAAGKPETGCIEIAMQREGGNLHVVCSDDGRGLDWEAIRRAAVERGRVGEEAARTLDDTALTELLLRGDLSTRAQVTEISGRGIGMDVLRDTVARLGGRLALASESGRGTRVEIRLPASLAALPALLLEAGDGRLAVPLAAVRRTLRMRDAALARSDGEATIEFEGRSLPLVVLAQLLGTRRASLPQVWQSLVILQSAGGSVALAVDRLLGCGELVARPLPAVVGALPLILGAALDADGEPRLVLDAEHLVQAALRWRALPAAPAPARPKILVVDDSITTRMLEQSILEAAGYEVAVATSAEEALEIARKDDFCLFVVDIEMPGMNGFDFVRTARADRRLGATPALLVSSLARAEDRQRGAEAGARGYIVKSEFDESRFLETVRRLVA